MSLFIKFFALDHGDKSTVRILIISLLFLLFSCSKNQNPPEYNSKEIENQFIDLIRNKCNHNIKCFDIEKYHIIDRICENPPPNHPFKSFSDCEETLLNLAENILVQKVADWKNQIEGQAENQVEDQVQVIQGQIIRGQAIRGQAIQDQVIRGQAIQDQVIQGQAIQDQVIRRMWTQEPDTL